MKRFRTIMYNSGQIYSVGQNYKLCNTYFQKRNFPYIGLNESESFIELHYGVKTNHLYSSIKFYFKSLIKLWITLARIMRSHDIILND